MPPAMLTLKQRLANSTQAASGSSSANSSSSSRQTPSTSNFGTLGSAIAKRKAQFKPPWTTHGVKSNVDMESLQQQQDVRKLDEVLSHMIFQAGVDYETRPLSVYPFQEPQQKVVMNASAFPDPRVISYDLLLSRILSYLDLFVESDYSVVFFAAGGRYTPSWNWVWKAYRSLSRKYRKNLKRLYIVHSSFFSKMLFSLAGAIISPKFFRKITYIDSLSSLACHVPLTQIDIPPAVYSENLKYESQIILPTPTQSRMFGVSLEDLMGVEGEKDGLPKVVRDCIQYLRETGLEQEGLFRRSPKSIQFRQVQEAYNRGQTVSLHSFGDPHLAAVLLKKFLRDLPEPVFPENLYDIIRRCPKPRDENDEISAVLYIRTTLLPELPPCKLILLSSILLLLHDVSLRSHVNRMDAHNLAIVLTPNLVASGNPVKDVAMCAVDGAPEPLSPGTRPTPAHPASGEIARSGERMTLGTIIKLCIERYYEIFDETPDRTEVIDGDPFRVAESREIDASPSSSSSPNVPSSPAVAKRESIVQDNESIDDRMLVMPLGPNGSNSSPTARRFPVNGSARVWSPKSTNGDVHSVTSNANRRGNLSGTMSRTKARSLFAPNTVSERGANKKGVAQMTVSASGTICKAAGSGVTAHGVTASGFFTPPESMQSLSEQSQGHQRKAPPPPPPPLHPMSGAKRNG